MLLYLSLGLVVYVILHALTYYKKLGFSIMVRVPDNIFLNIIAEIYYLIFILIFWPLYLVVIIIGYFYRILFLKNRYDV